MAHATDKRQQIFDAAYELVSKCFDRMYTDFNVAATYCFLGMYLWDQNELDRARFFIENVVSYLRSNKPMQGIGTSIQSEIDHLRYGLLFFLCDCAKLFAAENVNLSYVLKRIIAGYYVTATYNKLLGGTEEDICDDKQHYQQMVDNDFVHGGLDFDLPSLDKLIHKFKAQLMIPHTNYNLHDKKVVTLLCLALGAKAQRLLKIDSDGNEIVIRELADQICDWLERSSSWVLHHPCVSCAVALAMNVHMKHLRSASLADKHILLVFLKADIRAIDRLTFNIKYWQVKHANVIAEAKSLLRVTEERLMSVPIPINNMILPMNIQQQPITTETDSNASVPSDLIKNINEDHIDAFLNEFLRSTDDNLFAI